MAQVNVELVNTVTGERFDLSLPDDQEVERLLKVIVERTDAGQPGSDGQQWELWKKGEFKLSPSDTLAERGVADGCKLSLQAGAVAGRGGQG